MSSGVKQFRVIADSYSCVFFFRIRSRNDSDHVSCIRFGYDPKNPPPLWIIWINNPFLNFMKETKIGFWIKNLDLDLSKETHPKILFELVQYNSVCVL